MNLAEIKDRIVDRIQNLGNEIVSNPHVAKARDWFENLSVKTQKIVLLSALSVVGLFLWLLLPQSYLSEGTDLISEYESYKTLSQELISAKKTLAQTPMVANGKTASDLENEVRRIIDSSQLTDEQKKGVQIIAEKDPLAEKLIPKEVRQAAVEANLGKLNLVQVRDIGIKLSTIDESYLTTLDIKKTADNDHYFDVMFRISSYSVDLKELPPAPPPKEKMKKGKKSKKTSDETEES